LTSHWIGAGVLDQILRHAISSLNRLEFLAARRTGQLQFIENVTDRWVAYR